MTHQELVHRACLWLRTRDFKATLAEPTAVSNWEIPDAMGWNGQGSSAMVECKVSRADFLADRGKAIRKAPPEDQLGNERWFMTPRRLLEREEIPKGWGLVEVTDKKAFVVVPATRHRVKNVRLEQVLLVTALGRIQDERFHEAFLSPEGYSRAKHWAQIIIRDDQGIEVDTVEEEIEKDPWDDGTDLYKRAAAFETMRGRVNALAHEVFKHRRRLMEGLAPERMGKFAAILRDIAKEFTAATRKSKG